MRFLCFVSSFFLAVIFCSDNPINAEFDPSDPFVPTGQQPQSPPLPPRIDPMFAAFLFDQLDPMAQFTIINMMQDRIHMNYMAFTQVQGASPETPALCSEEPEPIEVVAVPVEPEVKDPVEAERIKAETLLFKLKDLIAKEKLRKIQEEEEEVLIVDITESKPEEKPEESSEEGEIKGYAEEAGEQVVTFTCSFSADSRKRAENPYAKEDESSKKKQRTLQPITADVKFKRVEVIPQDQTLYTLPFATSRRLVVFNLDASIDLKKLFRVFKPGNFIKDMWMVTDGHKNHENFAFIEFGTHAEARQTLLYFKGRFINGKPICIDWAKRAFDRSARKFKVTTANMPVEQVRSYLTPENLSLNFGYCPYALTMVRGDSVHAFVVFNDIQAAIDFKQELERYDDYTVKNIL